MLASASSASRLSVFAVISFSRIFLASSVFSSESRLTVASPVPSRFVLYRDGQRINENVGASAQFVADRPGTYRIEAYLENLPPPAAGKPWIISNPIRLSLFSTSAASQ